jgi:hypothetical protein
LNVKPSPAESLCSRHVVPQLQVDPVGGAALFGWPLDLAHAGWCVSRRVLKSSPAEPIDQDKGGPGFGRGCGLTGVDGRIPVEAARILAEGHGDGEMWARRPDVGIEAERSCRFCCTPLAPVRWAIRTMAMSQSSSFCTACRRSNAWS